MIVIRCLPLCLLLFVLVGCMSNPYGNFTDISHASNNKIAQDVVSRLGSLYAPASVQINFCQITQDAFGTALVKSLRSKGYAVREFNPDAVDETCKRPTKPQAGRVANVDLHYSLMQPDETNFYFLIVKVGDKKYSRAYVENGEAVSPVGAWVRKE